MAAEVVGEGRVAQRRDVDPALGEELERQAVAGAGRRDQHVAAVGLGRAAALGDLAGAVEQLAEQVLGLLRRAGERLEQRVLVDAAVVEQDLGAVGHSEGGQQQVCGRQFLADTRGDVLSLGNDSDKLGRIDCHCAPARAPKSRFPARKTC